MEIPKITVNIFLMIIAIGLLLITLVVFGRKPISIKTKSNIVKDETHVEIIVKNNTNKILRNIVIEQNLPSGMKEADVLSAEPNTKILYRKTGLKLHWTLLFDPKEKRKIKYTVNKPISEMYSAVLKKIPKVSSQKQ